MIQVVHPGSRIRMLTFSHPGSRIQGSNRHPISDPGSGSATLMLDPDSNLDSTRRKKITQKIAQNKTVLVCAIRVQNKAVDGMRVLMAS